MNAPTESYATRWRETLQLYQLVTAHSQSQRPMLELVRWLANSDFATLIGPETSHLILYLRANNFLRAQSSRVSLHITYQENFSVMYEQQAANDELTRLERDYASDEIRAATEAWIWRFQLEA